MTKRATDIGTDKTADSARDKSRMGAFWSIRGKMSAMLVKLSAVQTA
jgi:hypothetical protein